ncbi:hypothetical protein [Rhizobium sp. OAE497]|uniref:hypothetical protein n=1 Tax=Rhizobium sp. OAE497 TaxID=2663796 RepID=UPI0018F6207A
MGAAQSMFSRLSTFCPFLLVLSILLSSCSNEVDQQTKTLRDILSWTASAEFIADARASETVPETYSGLSLARCRQEVAALVTSLSGNQNIPHAVGDLDGLLQQAADAASRQDRIATDRALEALRHARSEISSEMPKT